jgi:hypothetical protein
MEEAEHACGQGFSIPICLSKPAYASSFTIKLLFLAPHSLSASFLLSGFGVWLLAIARLYL